MKAKQTVLVIAFAAILVASIPVIAPSLRSNLGDPIGNYNFRVEIEGVDAGFFKSVDGISVETEVIEYQDANDPLTHKRPGRTKYSNIVLKRGFINDPALLEWYQRVIRSGEGNSTQAERKSISIIILKNDGSEARTYNYFDCFPTSYSLTPLDVDDKNSPLTETFKFACERWIVP